MIEIECFHREDSGSKNQTIRIWINGNVIYENEITTDFEILAWRNALHNELLWLNEYILDTGIKDE